MAADEARVIGLFHDGGLDAAHIGDHRLGQPAVVFEEAACHGGDGGRRHRDEDDFGQEVVADDVDDLIVERCGEPFLVEVEAGNVPPSLA